MKKYRENIYIYIFHDAMILKLKGEVQIILRRYEVSLLKKEESV